MTSTMNRTERLRELAGSPSDESLLRHFSEHVEGERDLLEAYGELRDSGPELGQRRSSERKTQARWRREERRTWVAPETT